MQNDNELEKKLAEAKRQRELIRQKLNDADEAVERITAKAEQVKNLRQRQKKLKDSQP